MWQYANRLRYVKDIKQIGAFLNLYIGILLDNCYFIP